MDDQSSSTPSQPAGAAQPSAPSPAWTPPIDSGSQVVVVVSRGVSPTAAGTPVTVPDVLGVPQGDALAKLQTAGLSAQVFNDVSASVAKGKVIGQLPESGMAVPTGMSAVLIVSNGPAATAAPQVALPDVVGLSEGDAVSKLKAAGLVPQVVRDYSPVVPEGVVMAQLPNARSLTAAPPKRSLLWLWIALAVLALLLIGGLWYMNQNQSPSAVLVGVVASETVEPTASAEPTAAPRAYHHEGSRRRRDVREGRGGGPRGRWLHRTGHQGDHQ